MDDLTKRLDEEIIADAFADHRITDGRLAERLIRERMGAAARIRELEARLRNAEQHRDMSVRAVHAQTEHVRNLEALVEEARGQLTEAIAELAAYYRAEYVGDHPYSQRKLADALASWDDARDLLARMGGEHDRS